MPEEFASLLSGTDLAARVVMPHIASALAIVLLLAGPPAFAQQAGLDGELSPLDLGPPPDPDLVLFAGSPENYRSLMAGLTRGLPITLTGAAAPVTFTLPLPPLAPAAAVALLERARLVLSREAIAAPTPLQVRAALLALT